MQKTQPEQCEAKLMLAAALIYVGKPDIHKGLAVDFSFW